MTDFSDFVHICPIDKLRAKLVENYDEPIYDTHGKKYGTTFKVRDLDKKFFDSLNPEKFVQSSVGKGKEDVINTNIRSSKIYKNINIRIESKYGYADYTPKLNISNIKPLKDNLECGFTSQFDLIKYESGDHFNEFHYDTFKDNNVATLLIFPPKSICGEFTGGDLVFKINDEEYRIETNKFDDNFMCVIFCNVLHKCEAVTSGTRYVIKSNIKAELPNILSDENKFKIDIIDKSINDDDFIIKQKKAAEIQLEKDEKKLKEIIIKYNNIKMNYMIENLPDTLEENIKDFDHYIQQELNTLNKEYNKLKINIKKLRNIDYSYFNIHSYKLNEKKYNICVLPYYVENISNIFEYTLKTRFYIKSKIEEGWNITYMYKNFDFKTDNDEGFRHLVLDDDIYDDYGYNNSNYELHYKIDDISNGKCLDYNSEYNDYSGNDIYEEYKCSCLLIWK